jgi:hypothetical protein
LQHQIGAGADLRGRFFGGEVFAPRHRRPRPLTPTWSSSEPAPRRRAERLAAYADAGATWLVLSAIGADWRVHWQLVAEAATLLDRRR